WCMIGVEGLWPWLEAGLAVGTLEARLVVKGIKRRHALHRHDGLLADTARRAHCEEAVAAVQAIGRLVRVVGCPKVAAAHGAVEAVLVEPLAVRLDATKVNGTRARRAVLTIARSRSPGDRRRRVDGRSANARERRVEVSE